MSEIVVVLWVDSTESWGWTDEHDLPETASCRTVGFLVSENDDQIVLASSKDQTNGNLNGLIAIPKVAVYESFLVPARRRATAASRVNALIEGVLDGGEMS